MDCMGNPWKNFNRCGVIGPLRVRESDFLQLRVISADDGFCGRVLENIRREKKSWKRDLS